MSNTAIYVQVHKIEWKDLNNYLFASFSWECRVMCNLLKVINALQTWSYLEATIAIQSASADLQEWTELVQSNSVVS